MVGVREGAERGKKREGGGGRERRKGKLESPLV